MANLPERTTDEVVAHIYTYIIYNITYYTHNSHDLCEFVVIALE